MTTTYVSGGRLGDFIQQLSIVYERFLVDKKPAIIYISNRGDAFQMGIEKSYRDLLPIVSKQPYIKEFKIHKGEPYDIDLSSWRNHIATDGYLEWMKKEYNIEWGKHQWLFNIPTNPIWKDCLIINTTHRRFPDMINWMILLRRCQPNKVVFVGFDDQDYQYFVQHAFNIRFHKLHSLLELCTILNSCKLFIGSLSAPLSFALGLHTKTKIGLFGKKENHVDYKYFQHLGKNISSVIK